MLLHVVELEQISKFGCKDYTPFLFPPKAHPRIAVTPRKISKKISIPVARMTELGIPVFNTPGANANAVKELIICGLFLSSRRVIDGINHMKELGAKGQAREKVEKDKAMFGGREIQGKTLAVIGLGHIGAATARDAQQLGMKVTGYDPGLSVNSALKLPKEMELADSIVAAVATADYLSLNIPYIKGAPEDGGTHGIIGKEVISHFRPNAVVLNFARGELVDSEALKEFLNHGDGRYISDFPDDELWDHKNAIIIPHLGASTSEAEDEAVGFALVALNIAFFAFIVMSANERMSLIFTGGYGSRYDPRVHGTRYCKKQCQLPYNRNETQR